MQFRHRDGSVVHLAYCTNMHPAEDLDGVIAQLHAYAGPVRQMLDWPLLGVGLWLSAPLAAQLVDSAKDLHRLQDTLDANGLEVVTINGFPYQSFQAESVKFAVYRPDWTERERLIYTQNLALILHRLLPDNAVNGSISTLPLGWRTRDLRSAPGMLEDMAGSLSDLADKNGRPVRLAVEPEPGCAIETMAHGIEVVKNIAPEWIGMCLDACHLAVQFEEPASVVRVATAAGVSIVKAQVSSALRVPDPTDTAWLQEFAEPRFLHQARQQSESGLLSVDDLDDSTAKTLNEKGEWRVHYHVPLDLEGDRTTQPELKETLRVLVGTNVARTNHLEVETYTWSVLPIDQRPNTEDERVRGIAGELQWTFNELVSLGLRPMS